MNWNREYKGISISFEDRVIRVKCDSYLMNYLGGKGNNATILSAYILGTYFDMFHKPLKISKHSLAVEILIHAYIDKFMRCIDEKKHFDDNSRQKMATLVKSIEARTEVIDCGEKEVDNNRVVFDALEKFHTLIYSVLGDNA